MFVIGLVLAAGGSRRLGQPKQLLAYRGATLLDATLAMARACGFDQLVVSVGAVAAQVRARVDLRGLDVVACASPEGGCSSSIAAALPVLDQRATGVVLLLGDQPGVRPGAVHDLVARCADAPLGICRYDDGPGHPIWLAREVFGELGELHGDKAVWKLLASGRYRVAESRAAGVVPADVDTFDDYLALLALDAAGAVRR